MSTTTVDERIVSMQFDNRQFERNVHTTMNTLEKFKTSLNMNGATKGLENVDAAAKKVNLNPLGAGVEAVQAKFSALQVMGVTALANITNSAVNAGKRITAALTIDPVKQGFSEYETQINAVQTILANTQSKGTTLDDVNGALDELNAYADKTIYNFTEMTRNIGTFTAAGVDLDKSVSSIKGIANLAAVSGSTSQQASTAMYQLSQALAAGKVQLMDWNSVVNAGMGGQLFQDALKRTAKNKGTDVDALIKKYGSFRESLTRGEWLTSDILTETLTQLSGAYSEADLLAQGYTKQQAKEIYELSQTAVNAATKVKTFTQLVDTLKEALQSGWTQTWEILIGDFEEAKELWTSVSDTFGEMINKSSEARNNLLQGWADGGGRGMAIESLKNAFSGLMNIVKPIKEAFGEMFPPITVKQLLNFTEGVKKLTEQFKNAFNPETEIGKDRVDQLKRTFKGLFAILDIGKQALFAIVKLFVPLGGGMADLGDGILGVTASWGDWLVNLNETIKKTDIFNVAIEKIKMGFKKVKEFLQPVADGVKEFGTTVSDVLSEVADKAEIRFKPLAAVGGLIKGIFVGAAAIIKKLAPGFLAIASGIGSAFNSLIDHIGESVANADYTKIFDIVNGGIFAAIGLAIKNFISSGGGVLDNASGFLENIKDILGGVSDALGAFTESLKAKTLFTIAKAIALLAAALLVLSLIDSEKLAISLGAVTTLFAELMGSMFIFGKMSDGKQMIGVQSVTTALIKLSGALLVMSIALKVLSTISLEQMGVALLGMCTGLAALVLAVRSLPEAKIMKSAKALKKLSSAMIVMAIALKIMGTMSLEEMGIALLGMCTGLAALVLAVRSLPESKVLKSAFALQTLSTSMVILAAALKIMGSMSLEEMGMGLLGMSVGLAAMVLAVRSLPENTVALGVGMLGLATAMVVLGAALKIMGSMSMEEMGKSLLTLGVSLAIIVIALNNMKAALPGAGAMIVVAGALAILAPVLKLLGTMSLDEIGRSLLMIAGVFVVFGVAAVVLKPLVPTIAALAGSLALLGIACAAIGAGVVMLAAGLTAIAASGAAISTALVLLVSSLIGLIPYFIEQIGVGIIALCKVIAGSADALCEAATVIILSLVEALVKSVPAVVDGVLILVDHLLKALVQYMPGIANSLFDLLIGLIRVVAERMPELVQAGVDLLMAFFVGVIDALNGIDTGILIKGILGVGFISALMITLAALASLTPAAMVGVLGVGAVITELALMLAAVGGIAQIPGLEWLISEGGDFLQTVGTAIGQFIGGIVGGMASGISESLPKIGTNLSKFIENAMVFITGCKLVDEKVLAGVGTLAGAILALTAADLINGIVSFVQGGSSFATLGTELSQFMTNAMPFILGASLLNADMMTGVKALAETIIILTGANLLEGLTSFLTGGASLADFGKQLPDLGQSITEFAKSLEGLDETKIATVKCAAEAIRAIAEVAALIPNEGGWLGKIVGENDLETFANKLPGLGTNLTSFAANLGAFGEPQKAAIKSAAEAVQAVSDVAKFLPNEGGWLGKIVGENDLEAFSKKLPTLGENLSSFASKLGAFGEPQKAAIKYAAESVDAISTVAKGLPTEGGWLGAIVGDSNLATFSAKLPQLGTDLKSFATNAGGIDKSNVDNAMGIVNSLRKFAGIDFATAEVAMADFSAAIKGITTAVSEFSSGFGKIAVSTIDSAISKIQKLYGVANEASTVDVASLREFGSTLASVAEDMTNQFVNVMNSEDNAVNIKDAAIKMVTAYTEGAQSTLDSVKRSFKEVVSNSMDGLESETLRSDFYNVGSYLVDGFAAGINENSYKATAKAAAMAAAALLAAKQALGIASPSKEFYAVGEFSGMGFVNALDDYGDKSYKSGSSIAEKAREGLSMAIDKVNDLITNGMGSQPTIRPVLDLSSVESGVGAINGMFGSGPSLGVRANIGAISSTMNSRAQNGVNSDVVSAIDKLDKHLGNVGNTSYNFGNITYDDGSNIAAAVQALVRAANMERRV